MLKDTSEVYRILRKFYIVMAISVVNFELNFYFTQVLLLVTLRVFLFYKANIIFSKRYKK